MNLFVVGWNVDQELAGIAIKQLAAMIDIFPQLDPDTLWQSHTGKTYAASLRTADAAASPRRYVWQDDNSVTLYEGALVDRTNAFAAHDAKELSENWQQLPEQLEGQFVLARTTSANLQSQSLEIVTDPMGVDQVYCHRQDDRWLISNSVELISNITGAKSLDPLGLNLFLTLGWAGSNRTLRKEIHAIPGGQHWIWTDHDRRPTQRTYFGRADLLLPQKRGLSRCEVDSLASEMVQTCRLMAQNYAPIKCAITGGRDSRLITALLIDAKVEAEYYTSGTQTSQDVVIGREIARRFGLNHRVQNRTAQELVDRWDESSRRLIQQVAGLVSLWQVADVMHQPATIDRLGFHFTGHGGEIAKGSYSRPEMFLGNFGRDDMLVYLRKFLVGNHHGILLGRAVDLVNDYVNNFHRNAIGDGFAPLDIPDLFYIEERCKRWQTAQGRKNRSIGDRFSPSFMRCFVQAAYRLPPAARCGYLLHRRLIQHVNPDLYRVRFASGSWPSMHPRINNLRTRSQRIQNHMGKRLRRSVSTNGNPATVDPRLAFLQQRCKSIRQVCLDGSDAMIWEFVNRPMFERITASPATIHKQGVRLSKLYDIVTACLYSGNH
ncbi:MAG: hypothetical protein HKN47_19415 [Pirellulaceae bacterium]|nr:hypothetical protein [Pirellulaceae bacterium]